jgi:hypothetical protein
MRPKRLVYICDWLPPDYGAVGQYSELFARRMAEDGIEVVLCGLTTGADSETRETIGKGSLLTVKLKAKAYEKGRLLKRMLWTAQTNTRLVLRLLPHLIRADEILFTGSPPLLLHWIAPLNQILRKRLIYRITDFHPECLIAASSRQSLSLRLLYKLTLFWRRRVHEFEVLGEDQRARLVEIGIPRDRVRLKRDPSPVAITRGTRPLPRPAAFADKVLLLYSGNWGVAHDIDTFVQAYRHHHRKGSGRIVLWLNAVGAKAGAVADALAKDNLPFIRTSPAPLDMLASVLVTPDAHLVTLSDPFVGFVLPSKIYGCIDSGKPILFIGSERSDVHLLATAQAQSRYAQTDVGDVEGCIAAFEGLADRVYFEGCITTLKGLADHVHAQMDAVAI